MPQDHAEERGRLRGLDRRGRRRLRLEAVRREHRRRHVLHLGHHRQSEGRALLAPLQRAARAAWRRCRTPRTSSARDVVLPVVPMFHANGWALAFSAPMVGAKLVMPGAKLDGASIYELLDTYEVTFTAAVPTVWLMLLQHLEKTGGKLPDLKRVVIGGSACPRAMTETFQDDYGVEVIHAWGMTEMSPLGTLCTMKPEYAALTGEARARRADEAGPSAVRRRDEDHRRRRQGAAVGRQDLRPAEGARAGGGAELFQGRRRRDPRRRRLLRHRRRRHHRSRTATCRSPTAPRT